nr:DUF2491 family protein [Neorhizobium vignae]
MIGWFGGNKDRRLPEELGPLGAGIGGALKIDFLSREADTLGGTLALPLPQSGPFIIADYGEARLEASTVLSRYHDDEHPMIQVMSSSGRPGNAVEDVSFYQPWDSVVPAGAGEWCRWTGPNGLIGEPSFDADGVIYQRFGVTRNAPN